MNWKEISTRLLLIVLALAWICTRAPSVILHARDYTFESWQARKLLEYGFAERRGVPIEIHFQYGHLPNPEQHNYVHDPLPWFWWILVLYKAGGTVAVNGVTVALKLAAFMAFAWSLFAVFSKQSAFLASLLLLLAPMPLLGDADTNMFAFAALLWPVSWFFIVRARGKPVRERRLPFVLGALVFAAGQISWLALSLIPSLLILTATTDLTWSPARWWREWQSNLSWRAITVAAAATSIVFVVPIFLFTPNLLEEMRYILLQGGAHSPKLKLLLVDLARTLYFVGPALCLCGALGVGQTLRNTGSLRQLLLAGLAYAVAFLALALLLTHFYYIESSPYVYLAYVLATVAPAVLERWRSRWLALLLLACALPPFAFASLNTSSFARSETARTVGLAIAETTVPTDIVATNLRPLYAPFSAWDTATAFALQEAGDRYVAMGVDDQAGVDRLATQFPGRRLIYAWCPELNLPTEFQHSLEQAPTLQRDLVQLPAEQAGLAQRLRIAVWRLNGKFGDREELRSLPSREVTLVYKLIRVEADTRARK